MNFMEADGGSVLGKLGRMTISTGNYRAQDPGIRHPALTAQGYSAAFQIGEDSRSISTVDGIGVALGSTKRLHEKVEEPEGRVADKKAKIARRGEQND